MGPRFDRLKFSALSTLAAAALLGGCASSDSSFATGPSYANPNAKPGPAQTVQIPGVPHEYYALPKLPDTKRCVVAPALQNIITVVSAGMAHPKTGNLKIEVKIKNLTASPQHFLYHLQWFDKDGIPIESGDEGYQPWLLVDKEVAYIGVTAPVPYAADFGMAFVPAN